MKLNKAQFKKILKECIRELITEGAFDKVIKENVQGASGVLSGRTSAEDLIGTKRESIHPPVNSVGHTNPNERLKQLAKIAAAHTSGGDPKQAAMMESIFADTAMTTLQRQLGNEGRASGVYLGEAQVSPEEELYDQKQLDILAGGRPKNHWAALAFGKYNKK